MSYYEITKMKKELNVVYKISEDDVVYVLYRTSIDEDGTPDTTIINCYKNEDEVIDKIEYYSTRRQYNGYNYRTVIIEPDYIEPDHIHGNAIYTFYTVTFNDINSSEPNDIKVVSYLCDNLSEESKDYTTELIGVYEEDDILIIRMMDIAILDNTRMNRNEIIFEAKKLRKQYLMKKFDI